MYYMETANILTSKGTTTVPKYVRDELGLKTGDRVRFVKRHGAYGIEKEPTLADIQDMNAKLIKGIKRPTREDINLGMSQEVVARHKRPIQ